MGKVGQRRLKRLVAGATVTYVAVCVVVAFLQRHLIYFPAREYHGTPGDIGLHYEDVRFDTSDHVQLSGWWVPVRDSNGANATAAATDRLTILFFHGNAGNISHRLEKLELLNRMGCNLLLVDYRGYGRSDGQPSETGTYLDARAAWEHVTQSRAVSPDRIILFGESLGGAVAIELAGHVQPAGLIVESTFTSLADVARIHYPLLPTRWLLRYRYDSIARIGLVRCPKIHVHGRDDSLVPIELARRLFDAASQPKQFIETPGGHNESGFLFDRNATEMLGQWFEERRTKS